MTGKIFRSILAAALAVLLGSLLIIMGCLYEYFGAVQEKQMAAELALAAAGVETAGRSYLDALAEESYRLTWIAADGSVLYDAQADEQSMENHMGREEVRKAMESGEGRSERYSKTLLQKTVYYARRLSDGTVLRISVSRATMALLIVGMFQPILAVVILAAALAFFLAKRLSRRIVEPLNDLDLDHPLENDTYDELAPLLRRIHRQRGQITAQLAQLRQKQDEFNQITSGMNEGLVLLDNEGGILSINPAAGKIFHADRSAAGQDFCALARSWEMRNAITRAVQQGRSETSLARDGRIFEIDMSRIESESKPLGLVLLAFDTTEKAQAERARREFTANVSHELKTPLTSILGSSELIASGMVKPEDMPRFVGHIHAEASRLLSLIEDIIRLSQLDEGVEVPSETVDLAAIAEETAEQLREEAEESKVVLNIQTERCILQGVPRLFSEIVYNLTENAIKYNVTGGSVTVSVERSGSGAILTVSDTGIGIPPEQQERIFERFYRVDKSHSRAIGGTGLGLSIVKHAAAYLGAIIDLNSTVGEGTTVKVTFSEKEKGE